MPIDDDKSGEQIAKDIARYANYAQSPLGRDRVLESQARAALAVTRATGEEPRLASSPTEPQSAVLELGADRFRTDYTSPARTNTTIAVKATPDGTVVRSTIIPDVTNQRTNSVAVAETGPGTSSIIEQRIQQNGRSAQLATTIDRLFPPEAVKAAVPTAADTSTRVAKEHARLAPQPIKP